MKTNKSIKSRYKVTKNDLILRRGKGGGHLNTKQSRSKHLNRKRSVSVEVPNKAKQRFIKTF